jgi:hypothetical protein
MAEWTGLEPATTGVTGRYSNQLNYHSAKEVRIIPNNNKLTSKFYYLLENSRVYFNFFN